MEKEECKAHCDTEKGQWIVWKHISIYLLYNQSPKTTESLFAVKSYPRSSAQSKSVCYLDCISFCQHQSTSLRYLWALVRPLLEFLGSVLLIFSELSCEGHQMQKEKTNSTSQLCFSCIVHGLQILRCPTVLGGSPCGLCLFHLVVLVLWPN